MPKLRILRSARSDLVHILKSVGRESGSVLIGERVIRNLRRRCAELALLPGTMGRARSDVAAEVRSVAEGSFVIFFRYSGPYFEILAIVDGRRDVASMETHLHSVLK